MWRPIEQYGIQRLFTAVTLFALAFTAFRFAFAGDDVRLALPLLGFGSLALAIAVGCLTMTRPSRIVALGLVMLLLWGALLGTGAAIVYLFYDPPRLPSL